MRKKEKGRKEKKVIFILPGNILREDSVYRRYSDCYSALHVWRATVANLKKKIGDGEVVEGVFLCVCSPN